LDARRIRSSVATDVPPNFITRTGILNSALQHAGGLRQPPALRKPSACFIFPNNLWGFGG
jgi:hypothetical protein